MSLVLFMAGIISLVVYTMMRMLTARLDVSRPLNGPQRAGWPTARAANMETRDLGRDKRKLARMSREERARELILHHGGRNVSSAIRFLVGELEKQKHLLFESLLEESKSCTCSCHDDHHHHLHDQVKGETGQSSREANGCVESQGMAHEDH